MSQRTYPRIGSKRKQPAIKGKRRCKHCQQLTPMRRSILHISVEFNHFRGDDDVVYICLPCIRDHRAEVEHALLNPTEA